MTAKPPSAPPGRARTLLRSAALVAAGMLLAVALGGIVLLADLRFGSGRFIGAALGAGDLAELCRGPLERRLAEAGFQPAEIEFGTAPTLGPPFARPRTFGASFTFRDGAAGTRVDGVVACAVSGTEVKVDMRVGAAPRRNA